MGAYTDTFNNADLVGGILTVTHNLDTQYAQASIYDNSNTQIIPNHVTLTSSTQLTVDLNGLMPISGVWSVVVLASGAAGMQGPQGFQGSSGPQGPQDPTIVLMPTQANVAGRAYTAKLEYQSLVGGGTTTLLNYSGSGYLSNLWVGISSSASETRERTLVKVYIDGETTPSVSCSVCNLHCADYFPPAFATRLVGCQPSSTNMGYYNYYKIPFSTSIQIDLSNGHASTAGTVWAAVTYHATSDVNWGRMKRLKNSEQRSTVAAYATLDLLNVAGRGCLYGVYCQFDGGDDNFNYLEGNVNIYVDGDVYPGSPSLHWPGTEDFFSNSTYFQGGMVKSDYVGCVQKTGDQVGAYRFFVEDPIIFDSSLRVTWTNGDASQATVTNGTYVSSNVLYYLDA